LVVKILLKDIKISAASEGGLGASLAGNRFILFSTLSERFCYI
jgi:hypothetical protein